MKIVVIDGQGGSIGKAVTEQLLKFFPASDVFCIGTNSMATSSMLKAGARNAATGENPVVVACRDADCIVGPIGIAMVDAMLGEITPAMAKAVSDSPAEKILIPVNKCITIAGTEALTLTQHIQNAVDQIRRTR